MLAWWNGGEGVVAFVAVVLAEFYVHGRYCQQKQASAGFTAMPVALHSRLSPAKNSEVMNRDEMAALGRLDLNGASQSQNRIQSFVFSGSSDIAVETL
jgi:hypothetical protein